MEIGYVAAGNEPDERGRAQRQRRDSTYLRQVALVPRLQFRDDLELGRFHLVALRHVGSNRCQLCRGRFGSDVRLQPAKHSEVAGLQRWTAVFLACLARSTPDYDCAQTDLAKLGLHHERRPKIGLVREDRSGERRRKDADDRERIPVQVGEAAKRLRVGVERARHSRSLMTITGWAFGVRSSSGVNTRPCAARTPSMSK